MRFLTSTILTFILFFGSQLSASEPPMKRIKVSEGDQQIEEKNGEYGNFYLEPFLVGLSKYLGASDFGKVRQLTKISSKQLNILRTNSPFYLSNLDKMIQEVDFDDCSRDMISFESIDNKLAQIFTELRIVELMEGAIDSFLGNQPRRIIPSAILGLRNQRIPNKHAINIVRRLAYDQFQINYRQVMANFGANVYAIQDEDELGGGFILFAPQQLGNIPNANQDNETPRIRDFERWVKKEVRDQFYTLTKGEDIILSKNRVYLMGLTNYITMKVRQHNQYKDFIESLGSWISHNRTRDFPAENDIGAMLLRSINLDDVRGRDRNRINFILSVLD
ncbi:MAG: hypothetical protein AB8G05_01880 [Oligoflexales bacterium]